MIKYILKRLLYVVPTIFIISMLVFVTIQLPPGDYVSHMLEQMRMQSGVNFSEQDLAMMRTRYGLNESVPVQYVKWISNIALHGDFGYSFDNREPAEKMIGDRLGLTIVQKLVEAHHGHGPGRRAAVRTSRGTAGSRRARPMRRPRRRAPRRGSRAPGLVQAPCASGAARSPTTAPVVR